MRLMISLVTLGVLVGASPNGNYSVPPSPTELNENYDPDENSTEPPFNAVQYKEYLTNLECPEIKNYHNGVKVDEVASETIYQPPLPGVPPSEPPPLPPLQPLLPLLVSLQPAAPTTAEVTNTPQQSTTQQTSTIPLQDKIDQYGEYDEEVGNKNQTGDQTTNHPSVPSDKDTPLGGGVLSVTDQVSSNNTSVNDTVECTAPLTKNWTYYKWYQILLDNGGPPGGYLQKGLKSNLTKVVDPCLRPVLPVFPLKGEVTYGITYAIFEKVYRSETVQIMLPGTPHEFVDIVGRLVWAPPDSTRRYFHLEYRKDDTGLYFSLNDKQKCVFKDNLHVRVDCEWTYAICDCVNGSENCEYPSITPIAGLPSGLTATLVGG